MLFQISLLLQASENSYKEAAEVEINTAIESCPSKLLPTHRKDKPITGYFLQEQS